MVGFGVFEFIGFSGFTGSGGSRGMGFRLNWVLWGFSSDYWFGKFL